MNELTQAAINGKGAERGGVADGIKDWLTPALLSVLSALSVGGYNQESLSLKQLDRLNQGVSETNRLAELRGSTSSDIIHLEAEVKSLRAAVDLKKSKEVATNEFELIKDEFRQQSARVIEKADSSSVEDKVRTITHRMDILTERIERRVTQRQLDFLQSQIDRLIRETTSDGASTD